MLSFPPKRCTSRVVIGEAANNPRIARLIYEAGPERFTQAFIALLHWFDERGELHTPDPLVACDQFFHMLKGPKRTCGSVLRLMEKGLSSDGRRSSKRNGAPETSYGVRKLEVRSFPLEITIKKPVTLVSGDRPE